MKDLLSRRDWIAAGVLGALAGAFFAIGAARLGFYYDDSTWLLSLPSGTGPMLWSTMKAYIPGRNLFPFWQYLLFHLVGDPVSHLAALHVWQSALDGLIVALFFVLLRLILVPTDAAVAVTGLFAFWPIHGETHYWLTAAFQNLTSTFFVLLFAITSVVGVRLGRPWWLWLLDAVAFLGGLFTYDQAAGVLAVIAIARVAWERRWRFAAAHVGYLAALAFYVALKLRITPGSAPVLSGESWSMLRANILNTASYIVGPLWLRQVVPLFQKATLADWTTGLLAAAGIACMSLWLAPSARPRVSASPRLIAALFLFLAAYLPVWLWHITSRHHFLPSVGLFAGVAVGLTWILARLPSRVIQVSVLLIIGAATSAFAAVSRGESRFWEESFAAKQRLFAELEGGLRDKEALVLEDFPLSLGPAYFISPHDSSLAPRLLCHSVPQDFTGDIGGAPAPGGIFIHTLMQFHPPDDFRYYPDARVLVVQFTGWQNGVASYVKNPGKPALYSSSSRMEARDTNTFAMHKAAAQRETEGGIRLEFEAELPPRMQLAAILGIFHKGGFHRWGQYNPTRGMNLQPLLLAVSPMTRGAWWSDTLKIESFPSTERIQIDFLAVDSKHPPVTLGRSEVVLER